MPVLNITTLGSISIQIDDAPIAIRRRKALALLIFLAIERQAHRREALAARFWPDYDSTQAFAYLRQAVWELSKNLGEGWLLADRETIELNPEVTLSLDVNKFSNQFARLREHAHPLSEACPACVEPLAQAVRLYQGDFLSGFGLPDSPQFDEWQFLQAEALRRKYTHALAQLVTIYTTHPDLTLALDYARRWVQADPLDEQAQRALMRLYALTNQRAAALRQYQQCERTLKKELKIAPESATRELYQQIRSGLVAPANQPPVPAAAGSKPLPLETAGAPSTIPHFSTAFIGRKKELAEVHHLLMDPDCHLLSLVGPGGIGKTRLASQAALALQTDFPNGVYYLSLVPFSSEEPIFPSLLDMLGIPRQAAEAPDFQSPRQRLFDYLREKRLLLVLDNCEHLTGLALILHEMISQAPGLKLLATSRQRLNLQNEWVLEIGGMLYPAEQSTPPEALQDYSAIQLFAQSAQRVRVGYKIAADDVPALARIARLVAGMPLGLELAAAWVNLLSLEEIAAEIERSLDFLGTDMRDVPERQRSLRAVFDYSWNLLPASEQRLFAQFSLFQSGFTRQAAQEVSGASLRELLSLSSKSLLQRNANGRYEMHSLLHYYAAEKLASSPELEATARDRYCAYYCAMLADYEKAFKSGYQRQAIQEIHFEIANALQAWQWALARRQLERLDQALESLILYFLYYGLFEEGLALCRNAVEFLAKKPLAEANRLLGRLWCWQPSLLPGNIGAHQQIIQESLSCFAAADPHSERLAYDRALAHHIAGNVSAEARELDQAQAHLHQSLSLLEPLGEKYWKSDVLAALANIAMEPPRNDRLAQKYYDQCLALKREIGDQFGIATWLFTMGSYAGYGPCETNQALQYFQEAADIFQKFNDLPGVNHYQECKDNILVLQGEYPQLKELRQEKLKTCRAIGSQVRIGMALAHLGEVHQMLGEYEQGETVGRQAEEMLKNTGISSYRGFSLWFLGTALLAQDKYAEALEIFQGILHPGLEWNSREFMFIAYFGLGMVAWAQENLQQAWWCVHEALDQVGQIRHCIWCRYPLALASLLLIEDGQAEQAVELYATVSSHPFAARSQWFSDIFGRRIEAVATSLPPEAAAAARRRGEGVDIETVRLAVLQQCEYKLAK